MNRRDFVKALAGIPLLRLLVKLPKAEEQVRYELSVGSAEGARQGILNARRAMGFDGDYSYIGDRVPFEIAEECSEQEWRTLVRRGRIRRKIYTDNVT